MILTNAGNKSFEYGVARVRDFNVSSLKDEKTGKPVRTSILIDGREVMPTKRFWTSIQTRFGFSPNIFRYFDHAEVFSRISERAKDDKIRYCIEKDSVTGQEQLLAAVNPNTNAVHHDQLMNLLNKYGGQNVSYNNGIVRSTHLPKIGNTPFDVAGDKFMNQFVIDTPIDGFGRPNVFLSMLRLICTNGAVGYSKAFRSEIATGKKDEDAEFSLIRVMEGFNNEEGFNAMRSRFEAATQSWASVNEVQRLYKTLAALSNRGELKADGVEWVTTKAGEVNERLERIETASPIFHEFHQMTGDITQMYGLANLDALSVKRQKTLPASCRVYDLLNFATEIATHRAKEAGSRNLQAYLGDMISCEYDLEGTCDQYADWRDFFINDEAAIEARQSLVR